MSCSGLVEDNGFTITHRGNTLNKMSFRIQNIKITSIFDIAVWKELEFSGQLVLFGKSELKTEKYNHSQFMGQIITQAFYNWTNGIYTLDGKVSAFGIAINGWRVKFCQSKFEPQYFKDLVIGKTPKPEDFKIHIWPEEEEMGNLLFRDCREVVMSTIHAKAEEIYQEKVNIMNLTLTQLTNDSLVGFGDSPFSDLMSAFLEWNLETAGNLSGIQVTEKGLTASKRTTCSYAIIAANKGWKTGIHTWNIVAKAVACYDTIGICDDSFFGQTKPLLVGLGTYPGSHRTDAKGVEYIGTTTMAVGTSIKCTLDLSSFEFSYQVKDTPKHSISLFEYFNRGTRLFPALVLCNNSSYSLDNSSKS